MHILRLRFLFAFFFLSLLALFLYSLGVWRRGDSSSAQGEEGRLNQRVSVHVRGQTLQAVADYLSRKTGVRMEVEPAIAGKMVSLFADGVPLKELQGVIAALYGYEWEVQEGSTEPLYRLVRSGEVRQREEAMRRKEREVWLERLKVWKEWAEAGGEGEGAFYHRYRSFFERYGIPWWVGTDRRRGSGQVLARFFFSLSEGEREAVLRGEPVRIAWEAIPLEYREPMERMIRTMLPRVGPRFSVIIPAGVDKKPSLRPEITEVVPKAFEQAKAVFSTLPEEVGDEKPIYLTVYGVKVRPPKGTWRPVREEVSTSWEFAFGGQHRIRGYWGTWEEFVERVKRERIQPLEGTDPAGAIALKQEVTLSDLGVQQFSQLLEELHDRTNVNLIADYHFDEASMPSKEVVVPLGVLLEWLGNLHDRDWRWERGFVVMRSRQGVWKDDRDIPLEGVWELGKLETWKDPLRGWGLLAQYHYGMWGGLTKAEKLDLWAPWISAWTPSRVAAWPYQWGRFTQVDQDTYLLLKFYGRLSEGEQRRMRSSEGLALSDLREEKRGLLKFIRSEDLTPYFTEGKIWVELEKAPHGWWARFKVKAPEQPGWEYLMNVHPPLPEGVSQGEEHLFHEHQASSILAKAKS